jgi:hypothetical protein
MKSEANMNNTIDDWPKAIAERIADEWDGKSRFPEDTNLLRDVLARVLSASPDECMRLVGTGIIEESYFEPIE